jgi:hypothetical protein
VNRRKLGIKAKSDPSFLLFTIPRKGEFIVKATNYEKCDGMCDGITHLYVTSSTFPRRLRTRASAARMKLGGWRGGGGREEGEGGGGEAEERRRRYIHPADCNFFCNEETEAGKGGDSSCMAGSHSLPHYRTEAIGHSQISKGA